MTTLLTLVFDLASMLLLSVASALIIFVLYKYFRGVRIPHFWIYFLLAFVMLTVHNFLINALPQEPYFTFGMALKVAANAFIFLAIYSLYKRSATATL